MPNTKKIQLVSGLPKPDWSITDETNAGYIKNKPTTLAGYGITDAASLVDGKIPESFLPSYVDDVLEYGNKASFPAEGEVGKIYVDTTTNLTYRWSGSTYVEISPSIALGETSSTAYYGDKGKTAYEHSQTTHAPSNAEKNIIVGIQKNGTDVSVDSNTRKVNITVPTKISDLNNDSGFITTSDVPEGAAASTTTPKMDGTATVGTETAFARGDHIHPSDTSKVDKVDGKGLSTNDYTTDEKTKLAGIETGATKTTVDSALSSTSANPVQNKVVATALDGKLDKSGGTITGDLALNGDLTITSGNQVNGDLNFTGDINLVSNLTLENGSWIIFKNDTGNGGVNMYQESLDDSTPKLSLYGGYADESVILSGIATPTNDSEAANKAYVDSTLASGNAGSATKLATARYIDGVKFDGSANVTRYATCSTAAATAAKTASITSGTFSLITGARVTVRFTYANTASSPTLNVGETGAKPIYWHNVAIPSTQYWNAYSTLDFVYTGNAWELVGVAKDNDSTYVKATTSKDGLMPKLSGVSTEYLRGDGQWATVSSSSGGMTREFYTGKISVTSYTTSTDKSKIYTVTVEDDRRNHQTLIVDYKTVQFCKNSSGIYTQMFVVYTSGNVFAIRFLQCKFNSGGTITFSLTDSSIKIIQICGFY